MKFETNSSNAEPKGIQFLWEETLDKSAYSKDMGLKYIPLSKLPKSMK